MNKETTIYNELRAAAERVFNDGVQAPVGSYTLSDLSAIGNTKKAPGVAFRSEYNTDNIINISVNGFECSFFASRVFKIARRFEVLAKVSKKNCAIFTRKTDSADPVAVFTLDATTCDSLAACDDSRNTLRPALAQSLTLAAVYGAQRTAAALKAARRATIAARAWLRASHDFYAQDGDPIRCTGWQFVGYNIAAAVVAVLLSIKY